MTTQATSLDEAANLQMYRGSWTQFQELVKSAFDKATTIKQSQIDSVPLSEESQAEIKCTINTVQRKLASLADRAENIASQGRFDDLQSESSQLGNTLLRAGYYSVDAIQSSLAEKVRQVGRDLHLIETIRVYCDGGRSVQAIVDRIKKNSVELTELVKAINQS